MTPRSRIPSKSHLQGGLTVCGPKDEPLLRGHETRGLLFSEDRLMKRGARAASWRVGAIALVVAVGGTYFAPNATPRNPPKLVAASGVGGTGASGVWVNPTSATGAADSVCTTDNGGSNDLDVTNFGFTIPTGSTINGITALVKGAKDTTNGIGMTTSILGGATTPSPTGLIGTYPVTGACASTTVVTMGGSTALFGTTFTAAQVNAPTFGVRIRAGNLTGPAKLASVDSVTLEISYTSATPTAVDTSSGISPQSGGATGRRPTFSGTGAVYNGGNGRVRIYLDGADHPSPPFCEAVVNPAGNWDCGNGASPLNGGAHTVKIRQYTNGLDTISSSSSSSAFTVDATEPPTPVITFPAEGQMAGTPTTFSGTCSPSGATVTLIVDAVTQGTDACSGGGTWSIATTLFSSGTHSAIVNATNEFGNFSPDSSARSFNVNTELPPS